MNENETEYTEIEEINSNVLSVKMKNKTDNETVEDDTTHIPLALGTDTAKLAIRAVKTAQKQALNKQLEDIKTFKTAIGNWAFKVRYRENEKIDELMKWKTFSPKQKDMFVNLLTHKDADNIFGFYPGPEKVTDEAVIAREIAGLLLNRIKRAPASPLMIKLIADYYAKCPPELVKDIVDIRPKVEEYVDSIYSNIGKQPEFWKLYTSSVTRFQMAINHDIARKLVTEQNTAMFGAIMSDSYLTGDVVREWCLMDKNAISKLFGFIKTVPDNEFDAYMGYMWSFVKKSNNLAVKEQIKEYLILNKAPSHVDTNHNYIVDKYTDDSSMSFICMLTMFEAMKIAENGWCQDEETFVTNVKELQSGEGANLAEAIPRAKFATYLKSRYNKVEVYQKIWTWYHDRKAFDKDILDVSAQQSNQSLIGDVMDTIRTLYYS